MPTLSILLASVAGDEGLLALLDSLLAAPPSGEWEIVIADRVGPAFAERLRAHEASPVVVRGAPEDSIPRLRRAALGEARGSILVVTEDHVLAAPGWIDRLVAPLSDPGVVATAGPVQDALQGDRGDRAAFLCDYAQFLPGAGEGLPGINAAYRAEPLREVLSGLPRPDGTFWEGPVHARLARIGRLVHVPDATVRHCKRFPLPLGLEQRFQQGRHHAGQRWQRRPWVARVAFAAGSTLLPAVLSARTARAARRGGVGALELAGLAPWILALNTADAVGELIGALLGEGDALRRLV